MQNRVAIVTGASSGIGNATALGLARDGISVFAHGYRNTEGLAQTVSDVRLLGIDCQSASGDLGDETAQDTLINNAWKWGKTLGCGGVCILINLAGVDVLTGDGATKRFEEKLAELWRVDVQATIRLSRLAGERMRRPGGCIVNVGWDQAEWGMEGDSGELFSATKGAVMAFTRSLAKSLAPNVRVNCVAPGWIQTKWGDNAPDAWQQRAVGESLLQRWGQPRDVAEAICYLVSDRANFVNGQTIQINGGFAGRNETGP